MGGRRRAARIVLRSVAAAAVLAAIVALVYAFGGFGRRPPFSLDREIAFALAPVPPDPDAKISPALREAIGAASSSTSPESLTFLVDLAEQVDFREMFQRMRDQHVLDRRDRREIILRCLSRLAARRREEGGIEPWLEQMRSSGRVLRYDGFSILNRVAVTGDPGLVAEVAARPDVSRIIEVRENVKGIPPGPPDSGPGTGPGPASMPLLRSGGGDAVPAPPECWAVDALGAPEAWAAGIDGRGVVVGILDTGVRGDHEQLRDGRRPGPDSWYDPSGARAEPSDTFHHGTGVLSCAVGRNVSGKKIGIAPSAGWVAAVAVHEGRFNNLYLTAAADWMLLRGRPDVLIIAFSFGNANVEERFGEMVEALRAAETNVVFAAGNTGPGIGSNVPPANLPSLYPAGLPAFSVGGTTRDRGLYRYSAEGPNTVNGHVFPMVAAPAEDLTVAFDLTPHTTIRSEGTSLAVGYVAGIMALVLQKHPELQVNEVDLIVRRSAIDLGTPGDDHKFGSGLVDAVAALKASDDYARGGRPRTPPPRLF